MKGHNLFRNPFAMALAATLCAAGMWLYAQRVLIPHQVVDAAARGVPRGNLSDLYPRWIGARELLVHRGDPYSPEVAREIQVGYYGRTLDASRSSDPKDQQGFAYPVYVVFLLAPTVRLPFASVQKWFFWLLLGLTVASVPLWLRVLRWPLSRRVQAGIVVLFLGSVAVMQGLKLQQMSLLVAAIMAAAMALLVSDRPVAAGFLLALATIKPQLVWALLLWLAVWTAADWRRRHRWFVSFLVTMGILFAASEWWLPHWISRFWSALGEYRRYTGAIPVMDGLIPTPAGTILSIVAAALAARICWGNRHYSDTNEEFSFTVALVLAMTVLTVPTFALYNQVLLFPGVLLLLRNWRVAWRGGIALRILLVLTTVLLVWPWLATAVLSCASFFLSPEKVEKYWATPFWTVLPIPVGVAALMLLYGHRRTFAPAASQTAA